MATTRKTTPTKPAFDFTSVKPQASEIQPQTTKSRKPNPFYAFVKEANQPENHRTWYKLAGIPEEVKTDAYNLLRRAQKDLECGLNIREEDHDNGTVTYHYSAKVKKAMNYTAEDIRAWAKGQLEINPSLYTPKITLAIRKAYKLAHGIKLLKSEQ